MVVHVVWGILTALVVFLGVVVVVSSLGLMGAITVRSWTTNPGVGLEILFYVALAFLLSIAAIPAAVYYLMIEQVLPGSIGQDVWAAAPEMLTAHIGFWLGAMAFFAIPWVVTPIGRSTED